jgi:hypothetical protein
VAVSSRRQAPEVFSYRRLAQSGPLMPVLPVTLLGPGGESPPLMALVDSGADSSLFPVQIAPLIGIDVTRCEQARGMTAGGAANRYIWEDGVRATILGRDVRLRGAFGACPVILLGRGDFFDTFKIAFDEREKTFSLDPY